MSNSAQEIPNNPESTPVYYRYADGAGNVYRLDRSTKIRFSYDPVKPEESSSGTYDGGDPVDKEIDEDRFKQLADLIDVLLDEYSEREARREMGTGMFSSNAGGKGRRAIVSMRNPQKAEIEKLFMLLRGE